MAEAIQCFKRCHTAFAETSTESQRRPMCWSWLTAAMLFFVVIPLPHAAWAGVFVQQGPKLEGPGATGAAEQGMAVALSADGNTLIVGGPRDAKTDPPESGGAAWVFTRSGGVWSPQGNKLVAPGGADFGSSVALSADGNTALIGDPDNNGAFGAAWVFVRNGGTWTSQQKLVGNNVNGFAGQGTSVALSADGNTALLGGSGDNNN